MVWSSELLRFSNYLSVLKNIYFIIAFILKAQHPYSQLCACSQVVSSPSHAACPLSQWQLICWFQIKPFILYSLPCPLHLPLELSYTSFIYIESDKLPEILLSAEDKGNILFTFYFILLYFVFKMFLLWRIENMWK